MQVVDSEGYLKVKLVGGPVGPFVPYTGATANVDLGEYELKAGQFTLDTSPTGTAVVGTTRWNNTIGSSETTLKGGSVILKNGVDLVARVVNKVTPNATLTKANYTAVRVSGAQGQRLAVAYAQADSDANSADTIGLVIETIATNQEGFIMTVGQLEGVNTTGSLQGETWADGDVLYLSPTTAGRLTNIKPTGLTGHIVVMGYVEYAHVNNGKIYVKIMNGWELDELHNVYINPTTLANNNILQYDSADQLWKNQVLSTGLTVGTTPIASGTIGRVLFQGTGNVLQQSGNLFWDNTNGRLGIGTSSPSAIIHSVGTVNASAAIGRGNFLNNTLVASANNDVLAALDIQPTFTNGAFTGVLNHSIRTSQNTGIAIAIGDRSNQLGFANPALISLGASYGTNGLGNINNAKLLIFDGGGNGSSSAGLGYSLVGGAYQFEFFTQSNYVWSIGNGTPARTPQMRMFSTGNLLLQNGGTFTDAGFRLDVNGTARVSGNTTILGNIDALGSSNSINVGNGGFPTFRINSRVALQEEGTTQMSVGRGYSVIRFSPSNTEVARFNGANLLINTTTDAGYKLDVNGTARVSSYLHCFGDVYAQRGTNMIGLTNWGVNSNNPTLYAQTDIYISPNIGNAFIFKNTGNLLINTTTDIASSKLTIESTTQGFLPPRMTTTQKNAIASPAAGLVVYDNTDNKHYGYNGTTWNAFY